MKQVAWIDINNKHYTMNEISDAHLLNILKFIGDGGGYGHFLTVDKTGDLLKEAFDRGLIQTISEYPKTT